MFGWKMQENSIDSTDFTDIFLIFTKKKKEKNVQLKTKHITYIYLFVYSSSHEASTCGLV